MRAFWGWAEAVPGEAERIDIRFVDTAVVFSMIGYFSPMRQMGKLHWREFRLWGADVTPEQRRNNLTGLLVIAAVIGLRILFGTYN